MNKKVSALENKNRNELQSEEMRTNCAKYISFSILLLIMLLNSSCAFINKYPKKISKLECGDRLIKRNLSENFTKLEFEYRDWLVKSNLSEIFTLYKNSIKKKEKLNLVLYSDHLEDAFNYGKFEDLTHIYIKAYLKFAFLSGSPPETVELNVIGYTGYCNPDEIIVKIHISNNDQLKVEKEIVQLPDWRLCSLNFFRIMQHENNIRTNIAKAKQTVSFGNQHKLKVSGKYPIQISW